MSTRSSRASVDSAKGRERHPLPPKPRSSINSGGTGTNLDDGIADSISLSRQTSSASTDTMAVNADLSIITTTTTTTATSIQNTTGSRKTNNSRAAISLLSPRRPTTTTNTQSTVDLEGWQVSEPKTKSDRMTFAQYFNKQENLAKENNISVSNFLMQMERLRRDKVDTARNRFRKRCRYSNGMVAFIDNEFGYDHEGWVEGDDFAKAWKYGEPVNKWFDDAKESYEDLKVEFRENYAFAQELEDMRRWMARHEGHIEEGVKQRRDSAVDVVRSIVEEKREYPGNFGIVGRGPNERQRQAKKIRLAGSGERVCGSL
ncbi:hypothetical protein HDU76_001509 [Blyttiomyces sp. JEL0837]|nr:hypothetical protein HDU76_001509 [Blyttiomyces sp. JEL0837]